jgi:hypothetical protein
MLNFVIDGRSIVELWPFGAKYVQEFALEGGFDWAGGGQPKSATMGDGKAPGKYYPVYPHEAFGNGNNTEARRHEEQP